MMYFQRTLGLRFLFPVYYIPEVEITPNKFTSGQTIEKGSTQIQKQQVFNLHMFQYVNGYFTHLMLVLNVLMHVIPMAVYGQDA